MATIYTWLLAALPSFVYRVLVLLGFSWVSYQSISTIVNSLKTYTQSKLDSVPSDILQLLSLIGLPEALSIMFGALLTRASWEAINKLQRIT